MRRNHIQFWILLAASQLAFTSCDRSATNRTAHQVSIATSSEVLSEEVQLSFATSLENAAKNGDVDAFNSLLDWHQIATTVTRGEFPPTWDRAKDEFKRALLDPQNRRQKFSLANQIIENVKQGGGFKFLRISQFESEPVAVFRTNDSNGNVNYHQYFLKRSRDDRVRAHDIYIFAGSERFTDGLRKFWLRVAAEDSKNTLETSTDPMVANSHARAEMERVFLDGQYERALSLFHELPKEVQQEKTALLLRVRISHHVSDEVYFSAVEDFQDLYPNDGSIDLLLMGVYSQRNDHDNLLKCVERLIENVGNDGWSRSLRAIELARLGRFDEANVDVNSAIRIEPDFQSAYLVAIEVSLMANEHKDTLKNLNRLEERFGTAIGDLNEDPKYSEFVKSPQYNQWVESRH